MLEPSAPHPDRELALQVTSSRNPGVGLTDRVVRLQDGRRMRVVTAGESGPLVVLESGLGNPAGTWVAVQRALAATCRTLAYDRAGLGGSDPARDRRSLDDLAADLVAVLGACAISEPVVLVGHSWGGAVIRRAAELRPDLAAALVLVDPTFASAASQVRGARRTYARWHLLALVGTRRRLLRVYGPDHWRGLGAADAAVALADMMTVSNLRASRRELRGLLARLAGLARMEAAAPGVPFRFVIGTRGRDEEVLAVMTAEAARISALSPVGEHHEIDDAGHSIPQQSPRRLAAEIRQVAGDPEGRT